MIQCKDCEFCEMGPDGAIHFSCNPFENIKEPECLVKWQLVKLDTMVRAYLATAQQYKKIQPLQEKMMRAMEREIDEMEEGESWKYGGYDEDFDDEDFSDDEDNDDDELT
jgi:hypothetical protein